MPPYLARHLKKVAEKMSSYRQTSGEGKLASTRFGASTIWLSVNLERFMQNSSNRENSTSVSG